VIAGDNQEFLQQLPPEVALEAQRLRLSAQEHESRAFHERVERRRLDAHAQVFAQAAAAEAARRANPSAERSRSSWKARDGHMLLEQEQVNALLWLLVGSSHRMDALLGRVLSNLCAHSKTRIHIIQSLLALCERPGGWALRCPVEGRKGKMSGERPFSAL
jgi:E3 ubiquitin-protein ligase HUWE1